MKLKDGIVINCRTRQKALEFLKECYKQGIYLASGSPIGDSIDDWYDFKQDTCYSLKSHYNNKKIIIRYASKNYYMHNGYTIIDFDDLFKTEHKFKVGDKVRVKSGLKVGIKYGDIEFLNIMDKYSGLKCTIESITPEGNYVLDNGKYSLTYSEEMLEEVKEDKMSKCKVYEMPDYVVNEVKKVIINEPCVVVILNSGEKGVAKCCPEDKFIEERGYYIALARARKEKYLNNIAREDEIIKHYSHKFEGRDSISKYLNKLYKLTYK